MDAKTLALAAFTLFSWGIGSFIAKLATNRLEITIQEPINLSESSERRYLKQTLDFEKNKNTRSAKTVDELMTKLNANKIS